MEEVTLALAILLSVGFVAAKLANLVRLPSVTGYIIAGLLLGPSGFGLVTEGVIGGRLGHFTQIALMLIAFGIGEHLEIRKLRETVKNVAYVAVTEISGAFFLVSVGTFLLLLVLPFEKHLGLEIQEAVLLAFLLGTVAIATAPAATLHVMHELKASGPLTTTLMQVVAVDNGIAITFFGVAVTAAHHVLGAGTTSILGAFSVSLLESFLSLLMGVVTGLLIDAIIHRLRRRGEMLTAGLALLLLCGELARWLDLSPLLAGIAAGFTIVNRDHRDVRLFRILNAFEAPIYVLFFTLAGAHLDLSSLAVAGWVGLAYFLFRITGKISGACLGARLAKAPFCIRHYMGFALMPQAGVAIGLVFLIQSDSLLGVFSYFLTPVVLAGVVLSELSGPAFVRYALQSAGEAECYEAADRLAAQYSSSNARIIHDTSSFQLVPWTWRRLAPSPAPKGTVVFGAANAETVAGLARMATLIAHYHGARPLAVRVSRPDVKPNDNKANQETDRLFAAGQAEVSTLGYELDTVITHNETIAGGIVSVACETGAVAIMLGYPARGTDQAYQKVVEAVSRQAPCPVYVIRFAGVLHTERILLPIIDMEELSAAREAICALSEVGEHKITLLHLIEPGTPQDELDTVKSKLVQWSADQQLKTVNHFRVIATETRLETIVEEACDHDLVVMVACQTKGLQRLFFGSLAEGVAKKCDKPLMIIRYPGS